MPKIASARPVATWLEPSVNTRKPNRSEDAAPATAAASTPNHGATCPEIRAVVERHGEAHDRADQHHALDAEVDDPALLGHELARGGKQDRRRHRDDGHERVDDEGQH